MSIFVASGGNEKQLHRAITVCGSGWVFNIAVFSCENVNVVYLSDFVGIFKLFHNLNED